MATSIDTLDKIEILKHCRKCLTLQKSFYFSVQIQKWKNYYENIPFEDRPATANSALVVCNLQTFPAIHKILPFLLLPPWEVFLVNALSLLWGHLAALARSHLIEDHPSGLTKEQTTETMDPSPKTKALRPYPRQ